MSNKDQILQKKLDKALLKIEQLNNANNRMQRELLSVRNAYNAAADNNDQYAAWFVNNADRVHPRHHPLTGHMSYYWPKHAHPKR
jgi:hypothetical protein